MVYVDKLRRSGFKVYCHLTSDNYDELIRMAERLRVQVKESHKDYEPHLDLNEHKRNLALRYGAIELQ